MPANDLDAIAHLDWTSIRCQCEQRGCDKKCRRTATSRVEFHALDHCNRKLDAEHEINEFGNYTFLLCPECLADLQMAVARELAQFNAFGPYTCGTCGAPATSVRPDLIREVTPL